VNRQINQPRLADFSSDKGERYSSWRGWVKRDYAQLEFPNYLAVHATAHDNCAIEGAHGDGLNLARAFEDQLRRQTVVEGPYQYSICILASYVYLHTSTSDLL
jgi:hypothetical protein